MFLKYLLGATICILWIQNAQAASSAPPASGAFNGQSIGLGLGKPPTGGIGVVPYQASYYHAFGDSITAGAYVNTSYASTIAYDTGTALSNYAVSGDQACDTSAHVFSPSTANENPAPGKANLYTLLIGTNDANSKGIGSYEPVFNLCHNAIISWLTIPSTSKVFAQAGTQTGTWTNDTSVVSGVALNSTVLGSTLTLPITTTGKQLYIWYKITDSNVATFTYSVDGGSAVSVANATTPTISTINGGTAAVAVIRIPVASGAHSIVFTVTNGGGAGVGIVGVGSYSPSVYWHQPRLVVGGVIRQLLDGNATATATYDADVKSNVAQLSGDGLPVYFADVRSFVNSAQSPPGDMLASGGAGGPLHPAQSGHTHLADAFESAGQFISNSSGALAIEAQTPSTMTQYGSFNTAGLANTSALNPGVTFYSYASTFYGVDLGYNSATGGFSVRAFFPSTSTGGFSVAYYTGTPSSQGAFTYVCWWKPTGQSCNSPVSATAFTNYTTAHIWDSGTAPTTLGNGTLTYSNGSAAFVISATGGTQTITFVQAPASTRWVCKATDETTPTIDVVATPTTGILTTGVTLSAVLRSTGAPTTFNAADVISGLCRAV